MLRMWQWPEHWVYDHFNAKLEREIEKFGADRMKNELTKLSELQESLIEKCVDDIVDRDAFLVGAAGGTKSSKAFAPWTKDLLGYKIR